VTDTIAGMRVDDPYRALEQDSELTRAWIDKQTARTEQALARLRDPAAEKRLHDLLAIGVLDDAFVAGPRTLVLRREGEREQPALYAVEGDKMPAEPAIDPLRFGEHAALDWYYPSPDGRYVAFGISENGDERSTLRVLDLTRGTQLPDTIEHTKWCGLTWLSDGSGFYYTRYPARGEPNFDEAQPDTYYPRIFFHRLGDAPLHDVRVWQSERGADVPNAYLSDDDRYLTVVNYRGFTASDVRIFDRGKNPRVRLAAPDAKHAFSDVIVGHDKLTSGSVHRGRLYLLTNEGAERSRIVSVAPEHAADLSAWHDVVPEAAGTIEGWTVTRDAIAVHYVEDVHSSVRLFDLDGHAQGEIALPTRGSVDSLSGDRFGDRIAITFSSYFYAPALFQYDARTHALSRTYQVSSDLDPSAYTLDQASVPSTDGTPINVYYVHKTALPHDGNNPVLLYGYGGFDVSLLPQFTRSALYFIERGGIYAVANLRGGGEFGEAWHRAGMFDHKPQVFDDFASVIHWFGSNGLSKPERIAITGGSNGGLLMGALVTRAPSTFRAAAAYVGLYDMLRYTLFPPAELWTSEYGDPREPDAARYLYDYSPYHHVQDGTRYPAVLVETADHDTRVHYAHSTKFAARLQEAQAAPYPIYFYMEHAQGHGHGTPLRELVRRYARMYAFLEEQLGMKKE
jgi:prolyl oligopeptidase